MKEAEANSPAGRKRWTRVSVQVGSLDVADPVGPARGSCDEAECLLLACRPFFYLPGFYLCRFVVKIPDDKDRKQMCFISTTIPFVSTQRRRPPDSNVRDSKNPMMSPLAGFCLAEAANFLGLLRGAERKRCNPSR